MGKVREASQGDREDVISMTKLSEPEKDKLKSKAYAEYVKKRDSAEREFLCKLSSIYAEYEKRRKEIDKM
jgi:hypothetical protein